MKNYRLFHPNKAGGIKNFYGRLGDFIEDNPFKFGQFATLVFHPTTTNEMLELGRARVNFGINGDSGNILVSTDSNGHLNLKAQAKNELNPSLAKSWDSLYEYLVKDGWLPESEVGAVKPEKPRKQKNKIPNMPNRKKDAYKWVLAWENIEPKINNDPTLKIDIDELMQYLKSNNLPMREDTIRKIIARGNAKKIPSRTEFERENQM